MIFGAGISTSTAYTHRDYRKRQRAARQRVALIAFRRQQCFKYDITLGEYHRRLSAWCELRRTVASIRARYENADQREYVTSWMIEKQQKRDQIKTRLAEERIEKKARSDFQAFIGAPVD